MPPRRAPNALVLPPPGQPRPLQPPVRARSRRPRGLLLRPRAVLAAPDGQERERQRAHRGEASEADPDDVERRAADRGEHGSGDEHRPQRDPPAGHGSKRRRMASNASSEPDQTSRPGRLERMSDPSAATGPEPASRKLTIARMRS